LGETIYDIEERSRSSLCTCCCLNKARSNLLLLCKLCSNLNNYLNVFFCVPEMDVVLNKKRSIFFQLYELADTSCSSVIFNDVKLCETVPNQLMFV